VKSATRELVRLSFSSGIGYRQLVDEDPHIVATYLAVMEEIRRDQERAARGNHP
jgi:hypothetical protein